MNVGTIVTATAGRDSGGIFAVVGETDGYILIADGRRRRLECPKRKNPRHLLLAGCTLPPEGIRTNKALRRGLARIMPPVEYSPG